MEPRTPAPGEVLSQRYELRQRLGSGGAGVVYAAHDHLLGRDVAVKLLRAELADDPSAAMRFRTEAAAAAKVTHPYVVMVYDIDRDADRDYLVMELVDGPPLAAVLADGDEGPIRLPWPTVAGIGHMVATALGAAHRRATVHRDVKPGNVLLATEGTAKVADFGIARALGDAAARVTAPGTVIGTARYLAPEQLRDEPVDARADVYSLGLTLHEALTGRPPWGEGTATEIASRRLAADLAPPSAWNVDVPPGLDDVVAQATRLHAHERFDDGEALAQALQPFVPGDAAARLAGIARASFTAAFPPEHSAAVAAAGATALLDDRGEPQERERPSGSWQHGGRQDGGRQDHATVTRTVARTPRPAPKGRRRPRRRRRSPLRQLVRAVLFVLLLAGLATAGAVGMLLLADVDLDLDTPGLPELVDRVVDDDLIDELRERFLG